MARISDAVIQGLMNPQFGFTGLAEPIGMLMGGAQAQKEAQKRQMDAIQKALGAQDIGGLQAALSGLTPDQAQSALSAFRVSQEARAQEAESERQRKKDIEDRRTKRTGEFQALSARSTAIQQALLSGDIKTATMLQTAPDAVVNQYLENIITAKKGSGFEFFSAPGGVAVVDPATGKVTFEVSPYGEEQKPAKSKGQIVYTKPDGSTIPLTTDEFGKVTYNGVEGLPEQFGLTVAPKPADVSKTVETALIDTLDRINNLDGDVRIAESALSTLTYIDPETKQVKVKEERMGGLLGSMLSEARKKFGAGNEFDLAYASLRGMNAEEILQYLPPGPASNADMTFVKEAGTDPNSLSNEDLAKFLRIYKQVKQGQREKELAYSSWLSSKNTTAGFASNWALTKAYQRKEQLPKYASFEKMITNANRIPDPVAKSAELQRLAAEFEEEYKIYNDIKTYQQQVDDFNKRNR